MSLQPASCPPTEKTEVLSRPASSTCQALILPNQTSVPRPYNVGPSLSLPVRLRRDIALSSILGLKGGRLIPFPGMVLYNLYSCTTECHDRPGTWNPSFVVTLGGLSVVVHCLAADTTYYVPRPTTLIYHPSLFAIRKLQLPSLAHALFRSLSLSLALSYP